uniref:Uncharacterized protein n=1 Tax=viral metagenome TaxID=1070528 RepID=A0A6M3IKF4_9ZZZZ
MTMYEDWEEMVMFLIGKKGTKMKRKEVTADVEFNNPDGEDLPLRRCVCGKKFGYWQRPISIYPDMAQPCPQCGRKLIFQNQVYVYEVTE